MNNQSTESQQSSTQNKQKLIHKQIRYSKKRVSRLPAENTSKNIWICAFCLQIYKKKKSYMSYAALYIHVKRKHPKQQIHRSKTELDDGPMPAEVHKLTKILKIDKFTKYQQVERDLINIILKTKLQLAQQFIKSQKIDDIYTKSKKTQETITKISCDAKSIAIKAGIDIGILSSIPNHNIFKQYHGLTGMLSFGRDIANLFYKDDRKELKMKLQMALLDAFDNCTIDQQQFFGFSISIWGYYSPLIKLLQDSWKKWRSVDKSLLLKKPSQMTANQQIIAEQY